MALPGPYGNSNNFKFFGFGPGTAQSPGPMGAWKEDEGPWAHCPCPLAPWAHMSPLYVSAVALLSFGGALLSLGTWQSWLATQSTSKLKNLQTWTSDLAEEDHITSSGIQSRASQRMLGADTQCGPAGPGGRTRGR